jgi:heat shock transcription factor
MPPPNLHDIQATQAELENLQRLTNDQAGAISQLSSMLGPLSPSGRIPGLDDQGNPGGYFGGSMSPYNLGDYNVSDYLNDNAFTDANFNQGLMGDATGNTDGNDFNFTLDGNPTDLGASYGISTAANSVPGGGSMGGGFLDTGSGSAADTPSEAGTEEIPRNDLNLESPERDPKRRRKA